MDNSPGAEPAPGSSTPLVPVIETGRLILRGFRHADLGPHAAMLADPVVTRYLGATALTREEAWRRLLSATGLWPILGYGYWAVERKAGRGYIGLVGFADFKRDLNPSIEGIPEMGWILVREAHGQGYAAEAVTAALEWADARFGASSFAAIIDPANKASIRLAQRSGFDASCDADYDGETVLLLRRPPASPAAAASSTASAP